jgi:tRNA 2-(methylsulfanyl)-N6-isopentenyladenosine37 hydroxylase
MLCEERYGREATVVRLQQLALAEAQALSGDLSDPQRLRMHSVGIELGP